MEYNYRIAGIEIAVRIPDGVNYQIGRLLRSFLAEEIYDPHEFCFSVVEELPELELPFVIGQDSYTVHGNGKIQIRSIGSKSDPHMRVIHDNRKHHVYLKRKDYPNGITDKTILNSLALEHLAAQNNGFVFHCSYIQLGDKAILFTAPSETGKSTQASLWETHMGAKILNGDRAGIRYADGAWRAYGLPYAGSSRIFQNGSAPIRAIVVLKQGQENRIRPMGPMEALRALLPEFSAHRWDPVFMDKLLNVAAGLLRDVPVYCLECRPDSEAVQLLHNTLFNEERL